jgi:hypothetical protein
MAGKSDFLENAILDHILGKTTYTAPNTLYIGLLTAAPTDAGGGTEVSGGSYARSAQTNNTTNFPNAVAGVKSNGVAFSFPTATAAWGTIVAVGIYDASSSGNLLFWALLTVSKVINNGDTFSFSIGALQFTED